jgi:hypothetical protein
VAERIAWLVLALVHALPALAFFRPALLTRLYGAVPGETGFVLLHHRAALFLVVVIIALWAMVDPAVRRLAVVAVGVSMLSFLVLYAGAGRPAALRSIAVVDFAAMLPLLFVGWRAWSP